MVSLIAYVAPYFPEEEESDWNFNDTVQTHIDVILP